MSLKFFALSFLSIFMISAAFASEGAKRNLASVPPSDSLTIGQGEQMLRTVKRPTPGFLRQRSDASPSKFSLVGVCRDSYGFNYASNEKGYANCLDSVNPSSGSSPNEYFGPAQRQTGFGFRVGE